MEVITVSELTFAYYPGQPVLKKISFEARQGEIVNILGPNGCGKSTLLRLLLGLLPVGRGMVRIGQEDIQDITPVRLARKLAYVPQSHNASFHYSVLEVVLMGRTAASPWYQVTEEDYEAARSAMQKTLIERYAQKSYLQLSGGERQLALIARALAQGANYCIMDEPVAGLDYGNQFHLLQTIKNLAQEGLSFLLTTHHPEHAVFLGGRSLLLKKGEIIANGDSASIITASCICRLYDLPGELLESMADIYRKNYAVA